VTATFGVVTAVLELENLEVVYHRVATAIQGVSLRVPPAQIVTLLGTNGAGKTTTLRAVSGFLGADDAQIVGGRVVFQGATVTGRPPHELARRGLVLVPERDKVFETLTVQENLRALVPGARGAPFGERPGRCENGRGGCDGPARAAPDRRARLFRVPDHTRDRRSLVLHPRHG